MNVMEVVQIILAVGGGIIGWFLKVLFSRIEQLEQADKELAKVINDLRVEMPSNYMSKAESAKLEAYLVRIEERVNDLYERDRNA